MADWINWFALAGILVALELFTGTFYLLMIAIGLACGGLAALLGLGGALQTVVAAVVGVVATELLRRSRAGNPVRTEAARDPSVNLDIGQSVTVPAWHEGTARVMYRGAMWDVELAPGSRADAGSFRIEEVRGSRLIVANA
jgi:membrane protein implicated in regulation of membrane protease activity